MASPFSMAGARDVLWRLVVQTTGACMRHRVTGLAAEAAFFALLSMPPLIFALAGSIGFVFKQFSAARVDEVRAGVIELALQVLTPETVGSIIRPTLDEVLSGGGRYDVVSIGFVLALWSGSRALNVIIDTITIMYGLAGQRGIIGTRALSFSLYMVGLVTGVVALPLVLLGPTLVERILPPRLDFLSVVYWPVVIVLSVCFLALLYHLSVPVRTSWWRNLPGAVFTLVTWFLGSTLLRFVLTTTAGESTSIYGPLAAPIAVLLWLYMLAFAVLIGAALNATFDHIWPELTTSRARADVVRRISAALPGRRNGGAEGDGEDARTKSAAAASSVRDARDQAAAAEVEEKHRVDRALQVDDPAPSTGTPTAPHAERR